MLTEITFIFRKFEGYIPSGIGAKLIPVSRQAGWLAGRQADKTLIVFEIKNSGGQTKQNLACLNEDVVLPEIYLQHFSRLFVF